MLEPLVISANLNSLKTVANYIIKIGDLAQLHPQLTYKLRLAVDELATNIINYAYPDGEEKGKMMIEAAISSENVTVSIIDQGFPFDPRTKLPKETQLLNQPLEKRPVGSLGILLVINEVDEFVYERIDDQNINTLIINRTQATEMGNNQENMF